MRFEEMGLKYSSQRMSNWFPDAARRFGPALLFLLLALVVVGRHVLPPTQISGFSYDRDDAILFLWNFWWTNEAVTTLHNPYWTDLILHPAGGSLAFTSYPLPYSLFSVPFQYLWPGIDGLAIAFNSLVLFSFWISGFGAYRLARYLTKSEGASLVAGVVYGYSLYHTLNMARLHMLPIEFIPFYILALLRVAERPTRRRALALGAWLALNFYSSLEYALYLVLFSMFWLVYHVAARSRWINRDLAVHLVGAAGCFVVLAAPLLGQQLQELQRASVRFDLAETTRWSPALLSFVTPSRVHPIYGGAMEFAGTYGDASTLGMRSETSLGFVTLALAMLGLWRSRRDGGVFWAVAAVCFLVLMLGPYLRVTGHWLSKIPMPYLVLYKLLPPLRVGRDPTRLLAIAMLLLGILAAFGARSALEGVAGEKARALLVASLCGLILFESFPRRSEKLALTVPPVYREIAREPGDFAVVDHRGPFANLLGQILHGKRLTYVEAFPRAVPPGVSWSVDRAFKSPEHLLSVGSRRRPTLQEVRNGIRDGHIRYTVLPEGRRTRAQVELCRLLGAQVSRGHGVLSCRFSTDPIPGRS